MSLRDDVVDVVRSHLGEPYNSMDSGTYGWGCAMLCADALNSVLGTDYYGSCWNFSGDAGGDPGENQGGGEFYWADDDPLPGDVVLYVRAYHDGQDTRDYGHAALYVGDGMVVGAWGKNNIGDYDYWPGRGVSEDPVSAQSLGNGWRYCRCRRLDEEIEDEVPDEGQGAVYRLFDSRSGNHHWTRSLDEARAVASAGWDYEGVAWRAPSEGGKVYRCFNPSNGDHLLTRDAAEVLRTLDWGWRYEGVCMRSGEGAEVHRLTLPRSGLHFYTADKTELASVRKWMTYEGVAFYAR